MDLLFLKGNDNEGKQLSSPRWKAGMSDRQQANKVTLYFSIEVQSMVGLFNHSRLVEEHTKEKEKDICHKDICVLFTSVIYGLSAFPHITTCYI